MPSVSFRSGPCCLALAFLSVACGRTDTEYIEKPAPQLAEQENENQRLKEENQGLKGENDRLKTDLEQSGETARQAAIKQDDELKALLAKLDAVKIRAAQLQNSLASKGDEIERISKELDEARKNLTTSNDSLFTAEKYASALTRIFKTADVETLTSLKNAYQKALDFENAEFQSILALQKKHEEHAKTQAEAVVAQNRPGESEPPERQAAHAHMQEKADEYLRRLAARTEATVKCFQSLENIFKIYDVYRHHYVLEREYRDAITLCQEDEDPMVHAHILRLRYCGSTRESRSKARERFLRMAESEKERQEAVSSESRTLSTTFSHEVINEFLSAKAYFQYASQELDRALNDLGVPSPFSRDGSISREEDMTKTRLDLMYDLSMRIGSLKADVEMITFRIELLQEGLPSER